jgi:hypothetical protein
MLAWLSPLQVHQLTLMRALKRSRIRRTRRRKRNRPSRLLQERRLRLHRMAFMPWPPERVRQSPIKRHRQSKLQCDIKSGQPLRYSAAADVLNREVATIKPSQSWADGWDKCCVAILRTTQCLPTPRACVRFGTTSLTSGGDRFGDEVRGIARRGIVPHSSWQHFCPPRE